MLGGSESQIVAIDRARELGYRTVLCDYLRDNPGQMHSDAFYCVSTTDKDAVIEIAKQERVNGVVAYGSDPAAPTAAYVAEELGLPGIPYNTARDFCEKQRFKAFLERNGFNVPKHIAIGTDDASTESIIDALRTESLSLPLIIKPSDSSGSKGVSVIETVEGLSNAISKARAFSRNGILEVEEFIRADHEGVIEGELFVYDGEVVSWGLMRCLRDGMTNPLLPAGYRHPLDLPDYRFEMVKQTIAHLVEAGGIRFGAINVEMLIDVNDNLFIIDAGPRNGGNMLPAFFSRISGDDLVEGTLRCAMGDPWEHGTYSGRSKFGWYMHVLHSRSYGALKGVEYSDTAFGAMEYEKVFVPKGSMVRPFRNSQDIVGLAMFRFDNTDVLDGFLADVEHHIKVIVE